MNFLSEPCLTLPKTIIFLLLSLTGSIFLWVLSYPYGNAHNLQYGFLLKNDEARRIAVRNLIIASVFYALLAVFMVFQLILHLKQRRRQAWDPSIAMVNVHTPKPSNSDAARKRLTPTLTPNNAGYSPIKNDSSSVYLSMNESSSEGPSNRHRGNHEPK